MCVGHEMSARIPLHATHASHNTPHRPSIVVHSEVVSPGSLCRVVEVKLLKLTVEFGDQSIVAGLGKVALLVHDGHHA